jgi:CheY-like chemotaxis protein
MVHGQQTVLVVEDDNDVRAAVAEFLPTLGYKVLPATPARAVGIARDTMASSTY